MIPGLRGTLLSHDALEAARWTQVPQEAAAAVRLRTSAWHTRVERDAGPTWPARLVFDRILVPFFGALDLEVVPAAHEAASCHGLVRRDGSPLATALAIGWGQSSSSAWRQSVRTALAAGVPWCFCFNGPTVRIFDARRTHSRRFVELEVAELCARSDTFAVAWRLFTSPAALDEAVTLSERHRCSVRDALQAGVRDALGHLAAAFIAAARRRSRGGTRPSALDESLIVIYRVLFLLFAEARGLVPTWHPVFRESYTLEALRDRVEMLPRPRGVWEALQAMTRLAHRGCRAGSLRVPPFNGRLFSPAHAPLAESVPLDDAAVRSALLALTTRRTKAGRRRIAYGDLGVEHLGGVYERVLDYELRDAPGGAPRLVPTGRRKTTGTFYTPRPLTEYLVRRTLDPLVSQAGPDEILSLRVLDPAMGSGAFLVAACRYLAGAYEAALVRDGIVASTDITDADRAGFRRTVAQRTLFGVDLNPMAVQLARLSLWLTTLSGDRPLTFFDHHLRAGNSLVGATVAEVRARRAGRSRSADARLPLFDAAGLDSAVGGGVTAGMTLGTGLEDTPDQVRAKEALFARLQAAGSPLADWKAIADLWCAAWFARDDRRPSRGTFDALIDTAMQRAGALPAAAAERILAAGRDAATRERFFHWELEFPEVFYQTDGSARATPGFDAVIGNPPWEMLRGDDGDAGQRKDTAAAGARLTRFVRGSGLYRFQGAGHANLYQMFVERGLILLRPGGRMGLILPSGFASDHGCADLRRHVLDTAAIDSFVSVENHEALFPIHRGLKFVLMTLTRGSEARTGIPLRSGIRSAADFDRLPDDGTDPEAVPLSRRLIEQLTGEQLAIPAIRTQQDAAIAGRIAFHVPAAGSDHGWGLKFGRELNATDDRRHFNDGGEGLPVIEGKQIQPFTVNGAAARHHIRRETAARLLPGSPFERPRVAYRDVASSTNRLTLIAAVLPSAVVTTHTLFCLKTPLDEDAQHFVAGMFNSFAANYLARMRVTTHVTVAIVERLPLPKPDRSSPEFRGVVDLARSLAAAPGDHDAMVHMQVAAARLYGLRPAEFEHVLSTFPLVEASLRRSCLQAFQAAAGIDVTER